MALITLIGDRGSYLNQKLLEHASLNVPCLIIDCANACNPHSLFPLEPEVMNKIYVIELELLYKFRDVLKRVPSIVRKLNIKTIIVTTSDHLFNYQDGVENNNIIEHSWYLMQKIGEMFDIIVGVVKDSVHDKFARSYSHRIKYGTHSSIRTNDG